MSRLFVAVLNMSLTASYVALAVIFVRMHLKKLPKIFSYMLWAAVWFRLVCPVSLKSPLSLVLIESPVPYDISTSTSPDFQPHVENITNAINYSAKHTVAFVGSAANPKIADLIIEIASIVWLLGIAVIIGYSILSYHRLSTRLSTAILYKDNVYETDRINTPFVFGVIRPKIFIPTGMAQDELVFILKHEQVHIMRKDHIIKPLAFLAVVLHWFNPLIWLSFFLMSEDMEMSCDESVLMQSEEDIRASYSNSLLSLSAKRSGLLVPLTFGENNIRDRIKNVLNFKKPVPWKVFVGVILVVAVAAGLITNPNESAQGKTYFTTKSFTRLFAGDRSLTAAERLLKYKTEYVGNAPKVGNIIYLLGFPEEVNYDHFELHTDSLPYAVTVHLKTDAETINYYAEASKQLPLKKNAIIMFSLIGNVDYINFNLTDGKRDALVQYSRKDADAIIGSDVRKFSESKQSLAELLKMLDRMAGD